MKKEPRIGVYICWCGANIAKVVDVVKVAASIGKLPQVVLSKDYKYMCSDPGQDMLIKDIKEHQLDRIVIAACSPRIHEHTFRKTLEKAGLNPYMLQVANIREQDSWVHDNREQATEKAMGLITAAVKRIEFHEPLTKRFVDINPNTLIIGGGIAGITAALEIANSGHQVFLVEKSYEIGGQLNKLNLLYPNFTDSKKLINQLKYRIENHPQVKIFTNTVVHEITGYIGNFNTVINPVDGEQSLDFGNIIVATGLKPFNPENLNNFGYSKIPGVITSIEFEQLLSNGIIQNDSKEIPQNIAIIHCVGSRSPEQHSYCSRNCCTAALNYIQQINALLPDANIFDVYSGMRCYGKGCEELYTQSSKHAIFLMFKPEIGFPVLKQDGNEISIEFHDILSGEDVCVPADMAVLMVAQEAHDDAKKLAQITGLSLDANGFFIEKHPKLDPVATSTEGVYIVGSCQSPKCVDESINQSKAAVARVLATISQKTVEVEVTTSAVNEDICCGCKTCVKVCPYGAIKFQDENNVSGVNEILCKGCGTCASACPTGSITCKHFTDQQILSQIEGLLEKQTNLI